MIDAALRESGEKPGLLGTVAYRIGDHVAEAVRTTPEASDLQALLKEMVDAGCRRAVLEVSSHSLVLERVHGLDFEVAIFTNLSRDHLDFHGDLDAYAAAKALLFGHPGLQRAVINMDDPYGRRLAAGPAAHLEAVGYGLGERFPGMATVWGQDLRLGSAGTEMRVISPWGQAELRSPLLGRFNAHNLLAALSVLLLHGMSLEDAAGRLGRAATVPGRMERFLGGPDRPVAVVDYAHTSDALEHALRALRPHCSGRLWCVFGCGGERDVGKRPLMGACAEALADVVVVTDDNPRGEDGDAIVRDILSGVRRPAAVRVERARDRAIAQALQEAGEGDVVLLAGKGHERFQQIGSRMVPFSDRAFVQALGFRPQPSGDRSLGELSPAPEPTLERKAG
jgi:UDP-N-acetylmuramoyl-L-alanyl-D-glutamate--2,6-diaminopimelate ligase